MKDLKLFLSEIKKDTTSTGSSATYGATKTVGNKSCTIFVKDRTNNGLGKDDDFYYQGDISVFSQKEIKDIIEKGVGDKKYDAANVAQGTITSDGSNKATKMDNCKDLQENQHYELGSVFECATKATESETFVKPAQQAPATTSQQAPAAPATSAPTADPAPPAPVAPAASQKPAEAPAQQASVATAQQVPAAPTADPAPPVAPAQPAKAPEQRYNQGNYQPQWRQQPAPYQPSPFSPIAGSMLAGGAIGGFIGALFGGFRGFMGGLFGGLLGGLMNFGGGMGGGFGGGFGGGMDSMDAALNGVMAGLLNDLASIPSFNRNPHPMLTMPQQNRTAPSNLPELNDSNFDDTIKSSKTPVVVEFYADWCEPCKEQSPILDGIAKDYSGKAQVYKINADKAQAKTDEYKVERIPAILIFEKGEVVERFDGLQSKEELTKILDKYAPKAAAETAQTPAPAASPANAPAPAAQKDSKTGTVTQPDTPSTSTPLPLSHNGAVPKFENPDPVPTPQEVSALENEAKTILAGHSPNKYNRLKAINQKLMDNSTNGEVMTQITQYLSDPEVIKLHESQEDANSIDSSDPKVQEANALVSHDVSTYSKEQLEAEYEKLRITYTGVTNGTIRGGHDLINSVLEQMRKVDKLIKQKK